MTPERWHQITAIFHAARERPSNEQASFVVAACGDDGVLRNEVSTLLRAHQESVSFGSTPAMLAGTPIEVGQTVGPYRVECLLGVGGMGEVYRAHDTSLNRDVALKVLPTSFALDPDRLARFKREAHVLASLSHHNIGAIYGLHESAGIQALVLELIDGPTLAERIAAGPIAIDEALLIARQIADALEAAHGKGIVHRDLKPANIKVRDDGTVKVLDFGLAKVLDQISAASPPSKEPTVTSPAATRAGVILGTAAYMAPEQAVGKVADERSDIWAFGVVLYEMLTGKGPFEAETVQEVVSEILKTEPDWARLPAGTPAGIRRLLQRCLRKDRSQRLHHIADARIEINESNVPSYVEAAPPPQKRGWTAWLPLAAVSTLALVFAVLWWQSRSARNAGETTPTRLAIALPEDLPLTRTSPSFAISPDGALVVLAAGLGDDRQLFLRRIDRRELIPIARTNGAEMPFFSPDAQWIGFFSQSKLWKVPVAGGIPLPLADFSELPRGADWGPDGFIVFGDVSQPLHRVRADGGPPQPVGALDTTRGEEGHRWPQVLGAGRAFLYCAFSDQTSAAMVRLASSGETRELVTGATYARYLGHNVLFFVRQGQGFATSFDADRLVVSGDPIVVDDRIRSGPGGATFLSISGGGAALYLISADDARTLTWVDREGRTLASAAPPGRYNMPRISPDGNHVALLVGNRVVGDLSILDLRTKNLLRLTTDGRSEATVEWSPDGHRVMFGSRKDGPLNLYLQQADGSTAAERLLPSESGQWTGTWLRDGDTITFIQNQPSADILGMRLSDRKPWGVIERPATQWGARVSRDGRWLAYMSNESGRFEIFVTTFPTAGRRWQVSAGGGAELVWSRASDELYFRQGTRMMSVALDAAADPPVSQAVLRFDRAYFFEPQLPGLPNYDVAADGRFLMLSSGTTNPAAELELGLGWVQHLSARLARRQ